jgi:hypothetical protein
MKIEIEIDIESIVKEALKQKQEKKETPKVWTEAVQRVQPSTSGRYYSAKERAIAWEFGPRSGHRRTAEERALHVLERKHGRVLTPEEKGEAKALVQLDETAENKAKEDTIKKIRIDGITAEGMAAASKELAIEEKEELLAKTYPENIVIEEATIPKTEKLDTNSLFSS